MRAIPALLAVAAVVTMGTAAAQTDAEPPKAVFERAFARETGPVERVRLLECLAKEHPACSWSDDALWILGEAARQQGNTALMARYWQYLVTSRPDVKLEEATCELAVYRASAVPQVRHLLVAEGKAYVRQHPRVIDGGDWHVVQNARRLNVVPMVVWGDLAAFYEKMGRPRLALKAYRRAMQSAPAECMWLEAYRSRSRQIDQALAEPPRAAEEDGTPAQPGQAAALKPEGPTAEAGESAEPDSEGPAPGAPALD